MKGRGIIEQKTTNRKRMKAIMDEKSKEVRWKNEWIKIQSRIKEDERMMFGIDTP